jgi:high frequency lysogenization protein
MNDRTEEQVIAFAGMCQAVKLVQAVAQGESVDEVNLKATLESILATDPDNTEQVFGGVANLRLGLKTLIDQLNSHQEKRSVDVTRYLVGVIALERRLTKRKDLLAILGERITQVQRQRNHFEITDEQIIGALAQIYSDLISPLGPRIQVTGNAQLLQQQHTQHKIRAILLAALRAGVLWRQLGGKRRQIFLSRNKLIAHARACLNRS